uniref:Uncharacterized protein n=1 Tax=Chromera velia CCMP2878 TaxID=1169474 RepID=A0A0G4HL16_9ALVE|mmetsp:Transcript_8512/g.16617  ORF Transcript_8512/g.16617 Transcript_8512/m.16617 type:complete len:333 (+) Transcript_8512:260-1258(+)|eukprot:Cvel_7311.t1-p1 / transcript=Cvel_7311.t1 / gene=Cvel_7311 / organism=Chromera_velia_CCMP2878 / gene_product=hypothetical protein / transcript_product=hypothetical protein / location=Cvel_scaffold378:92008-93003(+) / protein_length=332 / sequence_SO=supercontig / SO=protein_coding / is_pseudo=false
MFSGSVPLFLYLCVFAVSLHAVCSSRSDSAFVLPLSGSRLSLSGRSGVRPLPPRLLHADPAPSSSAVEDAPVVQEGEEETAGDTETGLSNRESTRRYIQQKIVDAEQRKAAARLKDSARVRRVDGEEDEEEEMEIERGLQFLELESNKIMAARESPQQWQDLESQLEAEGYDEDEAAQIREALILNGENPFNPFQRAGPKILRCEIGELSKIPMERFQELNADGQKVPFDLPLEIAEMKGVDLADYDKVQLYRGFQWSNAIYITAIVFAIVLVAGLKYAFFQWADNSGEGSMLPEKEEEFVLSQVLMGQYGYLKEDPKIQNIVRLNMQFRNY